MTVVQSMASFRSCTSVPKQVTRPTCYGRRKGEVDVELKAVKIIYSTNSHQVLRRERKARKQKREICFLPDWFYTPTP